MNINVRTNISNEYKDVEVCINAPERNELVEKLEKELSYVNNETLSQVVGIHNNDLYIIKTSNIIEFFSEEKNNYCRTKDGTFRIKEKMYYLEEALPSKEFIRISNSAIININHVKCFNTSIIGRIQVKFKDGTTEDVSKRRTPEIMSFLKGRNE